MATASVTNSNDLPFGSEFWSLNGQYTIPESVPAKALHEDISCLTGCAREIAQAVIDGLSDEGSQMAANLGGVVSLLYSLMFQLEMIQNLNAAAIVRAKP